MRLMVYLLILGLVLLSCSTRQRETASLSPSSSPTVDSQSGVPTYELRTASPELPVTAVPTATGVMTLTPDTIATVHITEESSIAGVRWSADGHFVQYATLEGNWWEYELATGAHYSIPAPFSLPPKLSDRLEARRVSKTIQWFRGGISPSGTQVVYIRLPPGYNYTPAPDEFSLPPYEIWIAQSNGSNARSLGPCWIFGQVIWFDQERKIIFDCGYEGPASIDIAAVDRSTHVSLSSFSQSFDGLSLSGRMALSPDETKLAITAEPETVIILTLDNNETQVVTDRGYVSGWSPDGQRLYYLRTEKSWGFYDLYVYDLANGTDTKLLSSPLYAADGTTVPIPLWVEVSPLENAIVFDINSGVWLVTWQPQID